MARKLRVQYEGAIYHIMNRGDHREDIFLDDEDRELFLQISGQACAKTDLANPRVVSDAQSLSYGGCESERVGPIIVTVFIESVTIIASLSRLPSDFNTSCHYLVGLSHTTVAGVRLQGRLLPTIRDSLKDTGTFPV